MKTLRDTAEEMYEYRRSLNMSANTEDRLRATLKLFFEFLEVNFAVSGLTALRTAHLQAYQAHLPKVTNHNGLPLRPGSVNNRIKAVKALTGFMRFRGYTVRDMGEKISYVKEPKLLPTSVLTHREVRKLIAAVDTADPLGHRDRTLLELLYSTGVRNSELTGLLVENVNLDDGTMKVMGKGRKERLVPIGRTALQWLTGYIRGIRPFIPDSPKRREVFLTRLGAPLKRGTLTRIVHKYAEKAKLDTVVTPHTFRRSCATEMIRGNANLYHVKELLGHESLSTLNAYTKLTINDLRKTHAKCHPREKDYL